MHSGAQNEKRLKWNGSEGNLYDRYGKDAAQSRNARMEGLCLPTTHWMESQCEASQLRYVDSAKS
jgi:hypothetical protein